MTKEKLNSEVNALLPKVLSAIKGASPVVAANALYRAMEIVELANGLSSKEAPE